jgi:hypothetical protein
MVWKAHSRQISKFQDGQLMNYDKPSSIVLVHLGMIFMLKEWF